MHDKAAPTTGKSNPANMSLTPRQVQILDLVAEGLADKEISALLHISEETVAYHLRVMFDHHQVHSRAGLVGVLAHRLPNPAGDSPSASRSYTNV
jgi:DNA-binding NarL/FixJ family response regulator